MDFIKYSLVILGVAILSSVAITSARDAKIVPEIGVNYILKKNNAQWSNYHTKETVSSQRYYNDDTFTVLTNPCSTCKIETKLYLSGSQVGGTLITTKGQTKNFGDVSSYLGTYRLSLKRYDYSPLDTHHFGYWKINE